MSTTERRGTIELDGRRLSWRALGEGPPLLLLNGYAATAADWDPGFLAALGQTHEVICPDNRGVGGSLVGELTPPLTAAAMAADAEVLLDELEIDRLPIAGWSMGGFIAQELAVRAPARVEALVLLGTSPGGAAIVSAEPGVFQRLIDHTGSPEEQARRLLSLLFPPGVADAMGPEVVEIVATARAALTDTGLDAQESAVAAWHRNEPPPPPDPAPPVLVAHGDRDVLLPPANAAALAARWPGATVELFAGGGHAFMAQEPDRLAELITSFLHQ